MPGARPLVLACLLAVGCSASPPPNIVLIVIDTVRADRLSCYGYNRPTTPNIDGLCARGIRFANASSTSTWTLPAHASLFTGRFPIEHGATQENTELSGALPTLAELLSARGYATFGASANPVVSVNSGLARGFQEFSETWRNRGRWLDPRPEQHYNLRAARTLLGELPPERPFFLFVNYVEAHGPYKPPEPWRSRFLAQPNNPAALSASRHQPSTYYTQPSSIGPRDFAVLSDLYDGEVAFVDALVGALVKELEASGRLENTVLVLTSDHGENLGDHGHFRHVFSLYNSTVRVPLVIVLPDGSRAGEVNDEPVGLVDLFATLLHLAGAEPPPGLTGRDLLAGPRDVPPPVFAEYYYPLQALELFGPEGAEAHHPALAPHLRRLRSVEAGGLRLIWSSDGRHELFNLVDDPDEQNDLAGEAWVAERERRLHAELEEYVARGGGPRPLPDTATRRAPTGAFGDVDEESAALLRELGYVP